MFNKTITNSHFCRFYIIGFEEIIKWVIYFKLQNFYYFEDAKFTKSIICKFYYTLKFVEA